MTKLFVFALMAFFSQSNNHLQKYSLETYPVHLETNFAKDADIRLSTFKIIPKDISGCVLYLYQSKNDEKKEVYLMVENFAQYGYISINGRMQHFNLTSYKDMSYYIYSTGVYILKIEIKKKTDIGNEDFRVIGVLTLLKGKTILDRKNFIGEYTC
jgi:hypothetical protein